MYNKIVNPLTNRKVLVNSRLGQQIINNYMNQLGGATSDSDDDSFDDRVNRARSNWGSLRGDVRNNANRYREMGRRVNAGRNWANLRRDVRDNANRYREMGRARTNARRNWGNLRRDVRDNANRYREMARNMNGHVDDNNNNMNDNSNNNNMTGNVG